MKRSSFSLLRRLRAPSLAAALGLLASVPLEAQVLEVRVDGTIQTNLPVAAEHSADSNVMGYERIWSGGIYQTTPASPFGFPTAAQPVDPLFYNKSFSLVGRPFTLKLLVDTRLLPTADLGSGPAATSYSDLVFGWFQSPTYQPYTPWLRASLTLNGITQSYVGDQASSASLGDANAVNPFASPRTQGNFTLNELTSPVAPWNAGYYDVSGINLQFDLPQDILSGTAFAQPLSFSLSNPGGLAGVTGNFSVWETTFVNGQRTSLAQDTGILNATSFSLRSFDPDAPLDGGNGAPSVTPVPEPSTYGLLGATVLGVAGWYRRRLARRTGA